MRIGREHRLHFLLKIVIPGADFRQKLRAGLGIAARSCLEQLVYLAITLRCHGCGQALCAATPWRRANRASPFPERPGGLSPSLPRAARQKSAARSLRSAVGEAWTDG